MVPPHLSSCVASKFSQNCILWHDTLGHESQHDWLHAERILSCKDLKCDSEFQNFAFSAFSVFFSGETTLWEEQFTKPYHEVKLRVVLVFVVVFVLDLEQTSFKGFLTFAVDVQQIHVEQLLSKACLGVEHLILELSFEKALPKSLLPFLCCEHGPVFTSGDLGDSEI